MKILLSYDPTIALRIWADYSAHIDDRTTVGQLFIYMIDEEKERLNALWWGHPCGEDFECHVVYFGGGHKEVAEAFFDFVREELGCSRLVCYLPKSNRAVRFAALRGGFRKVENVDNVAFLKNGEFEECDKFIKG